MINILEKLTEELNNAQKEAVKKPINYCTKIVAGAGSGKTKIISKRFTKLIYDLIAQNIEQPSSRILVITFTDKAANEMKERIIKELNQNNLNTFEDELWISTFHGFCNKILRRHSIEANLSPDFVLAEETELFKIYENIIKILKNDEYNFIENINEICNDLDLPLDILKISNLKKLSAISSLDDLFVDIFNIIKKIKSLGLTPKEFLQKTISSTLNFSKTISSLPFGFQTPEDYVINWENHLKPYTDNFCVFEKDSTFKGLTQKPLILAKNGQRNAEKWTAADNFPQNISNFEEIENYLIKVIVLIYAIYQNQLEINNITDFDDLINKTIFVLKNNLLVRAYYQKYFKHLIIDEFQDTNGSQLELIKLLLNDTAPNITFVGDRKQSIYGFRYAQMENLEVLHKFIEQKYKQKYPEIKLETNYRSTSHVLDIVNYVTEEYLQLDEKLNACEAKTLDEERKFVINAELKNCENAIFRKELEAKYIAQKIQTLKKEQNAKYKDFAILVKSHSQSELIERILTKYGIPSIKKTNKGFFEHSTIKNAKAALKLIQNPYDEIALTRILKINLSDKELYNIKNETDEKYKKIFEENKEKYPNFCEKTLKLIEKNEKIPQALNKIYEVLNNIIKNKNKKPLLFLFNSFAKHISLFEATTQTEEFQSNIKLRIFEKIISDYEQNKRFTTINNFLEYLEKIEEDRTFELPDVLSVDIDAVQIMTIHASKGLEFPYTFICSLSNSGRKTDGKIILDLQYGNKPGFGLIITQLNGQDSPKNLVYKEIWQKPRDLNEAIRLFYVATSRAEKYLNIITFEEKGSSKPAFYTKDFPNFILKKEILEENINPAKDAIKLPKIQKSSLPQNFTSLKEITDLKTTHKFSFSKLNTYKVCPHKFLLKYKMGYPSLSSQNKGSQIGKIVHKLIYNSLVFNQILSNEEINILLKEYNVDEDRKVAILNAYNNFKTCKFSPQNLVNREFSAEYNFNFIYNLSEKNIEFTGDIDLLVKNDDNSFSIVDFKTNANIEKEKDIYYSQLYLYKKAIESQGFIVQSAEILSLNKHGNIDSFYLKNDEKIKLEFEEDLKNAISCFENEINLEKIKKTEKCKNCEYNYICL